MILNCEQGKVDGCVVDFVNRRSDVSDCFSLFWEKTTIQNYINYNSLDNELYRLRKELVQLLGEIIHPKSLPVAKRKNDREQFQSLIHHQLLDKNYYHSISTKVHRYLYLCNTLQSSSPDISNTLLNRLISFINSQLSTSSSHLLDKCKDKIKVQISEQVKANTYILFLSFPFPFPLSLSLSFLFVFPTLFPCLFPHLPSYNRFSPSFCIITTLPPSLLSLSFCLFATLLPIPCSSCFFSDLVLQSASSFPRMLYQLSNSIYVGLINIKGRNSSAKNNKGKGDQRKNGIIEITCHGSNGNIGDSQADYQ